MRFLAKKIELNLTKNFIDDFILYSVLGIIIGGRIGYITIYNPIYYINDPLLIFNTLQGGMSFHGGLIGFFISIILLAKKLSISPWKILDLSACAAPIGIFFGRIANFINGELVGRTTDVPWSVIFPMHDSFPRHPSQLYEAMSEGLILFLIINILFFQFKFFKKEL